SGKRWENDKRGGMLATLQHGATMTKRALGAILLLAVLCRADSNFQQLDESATNLKSAADDARAKALETWGETAEAKALKDGLQAAQAKYDDAKASGTPQDRLAAATI